MFPFYYNFICRTVHVIYFRNFDNLSLEYELHVWVLLDCHIFFKFLAAPEEEIDLLLEGNVIPRSNRFLPQVQPKFNCSDDTKSARSGQRCIHRTLHHCHRTTRYSTTTAQKVKPHILRSITPFLNPYRLSDNVEKCNRLGLVTDENMTHARCMLDT